MSAPKALGLWSGVGLVIANMVGAGVFLSTGFMAQSTSPGVILLAWLIGAVLALAGAVAYAEVARLVPQGGGEYRYLSSLMHPSVGYLAGWASLLVGFSAPIALDALAAGAFASAVVPGVEPKLVAAILLVTLTGIHAVGLHLSARVQNVLVGVKVLLLTGFVVIGVVMGKLGWPSWTPPDTSGNTLSGVAGSLFYIAFAFAGWNAAVYAADEFREPNRDVPRAMLIGCVAVGALYLVVNYIFVANLTPTDGTVVFGYDKFSSGTDTSSAQVTLGQAVMAHLLGDGAAKVMSAVMLLLFISAMSAMTMVGPRVYAAMARDGVLPKVLAGQEGKPPTFAVLLQGALALLVLFTHELREVLGNVGAILTLFSALTVAGLFTRLGAAKPEDRPTPLSLIAAGVYVLSAGWMFYFGLQQHASLYVWVGGVAVVALVVFFATKGLRKPEAKPGAAAP